MRGEVRVFEALTVNYILGLNLKFFVCQDSRFRDGYLGSQFQLGDLEQTRIPGTKIMICHIRNFILFCIYWFIQYG